MKISSRFRDYYDYVAHAYGGGDERVMYIREPLKDDQTSPSTVSRSAFAYPTLNEAKTDVKFLVINGRYFVLVSVRDDLGILGPYRLYTEENFKNILPKIQISYYRYSDTRATNWSRYFNIESEFALNLSRSIQHPVFLVNGVSWDWKAQRYFTSIDKNIPILADYGIPHHFSPEQMYQDIAYFISNKMVTSPDLEVHDS